MRLVCKEVRVKDNDPYNAEQAFRVFDIEEPEIEEWLYGGQQEGYEVRRYVDGVELKVAARGPHDRDPREKRIREIAFREALAVVKAIAPEPPAGSDVEVWTKALIRHFEGKARGEE